MNKLLILFLVTFTIIAINASEDGHDHSTHSDASGHGSIDTPLTPQQLEDEGHGHDHGSHSGHDDLGGSEEHSDHEDHEEEGHDDHGHGHGGGKAIGVGKAIIEVDETKGFKLSHEAFKTLKIKLKSAKGSTFKISKSTLVTSKNLKGIYRLRAGFFKLLPVSITKEVKGGYMVKVSGIKTGDQIVVQGVGLLRVADVYSTDKSEYGHAH